MEESGFGCGVYLRTEATITYEEETDVKRRKIWLAGLAVMLGVFFGKGLTSEAQEPVPAGFVQTEEGVMWRNADGTWARNCWINLGNLRYHTDSDGYIQVGLVETDGSVYYLNADGTMAVGLLPIGEDTYFFQSDGTMAINTTINGYQFGSDGKMVVQPQGETSLAPILDSIIASVTTPEMTDEQKLAACYRYILDASSYKRTYERPSGDWTWQYAVDILTTGQGNCYRYAAGFACLAKRLGFDARVATGQIKARRGGVTPHGWTEIRIGDTWYLFDPDMQDANGRDYYRKTYAAYPTKPLIKEAEWAVYF